MKIKSIKTYLKDFELTRPYTVAYATKDHVQNVILQVELDSGLIGFGCAAPAKDVTGEDIDETLRVLHADALVDYIGRDIQALPNLKHLYTKQLHQTPAACAALDIALHDAYAQSLGLPLVQVLGQVHKALPTSITIGIKNVEDTLSEAKEYVERGFTHLKVKLGHSLDEDIARLIKIREHYTDVVIRVDPNQGYSLSDCNQFIKSTQHLNIELIEQPMQVSDTSLLYQLEDNHRKKIALDESLLTAKDAIQLLQPEPCCGIFNIKLMKCGGIYQAQRIATIAEAANIELMWGCNDESIISISAALHVAFASPATRYIDLDGSLDLADDIVQGGFNLHDGMMSPLVLPGLGLSLVSGGR